MKDLLKTLRLAFYVCALPLVATAVASGHQWFMTQQVDEAVAVKSVADHSTDAIDFVRNHAVKLDDEGKVQGRLWAIDSESAFTAGAEEVKVTFVKNGQVKAETFTDENGEFSVGGLEAGAYSFVAVSKKSVATFGVKVASADNQDVASDLQIEAAMVSPEITTVRSLINSNSSQLVKMSGTETNSTAVGGNRIMLSQENSLSGKIVSFFETEEQNVLEGTKVFLLKDDLKVSETKTDLDGKYSFSDVEPGIYDIIATGKAGVAAFRFEAVEEEVSTSVGAAAAVTPPLVQDIPLAADTEIFTQQDDTIIDDGGTVFFDTPVQTFAGDTTTGIVRGGGRRGGLIGLAGLAGFAGFAGGGTGTGTGGGVPPGPMSPPN